LRQCRTSHGVSVAGGIGRVTRLSPVVRPSAGSGKQDILFGLADAAIGRPDETVRTALYPVVGEKTLHDLVAQAKANEKVFKAKVRTALRSSHSSYYRQMLPPLLRTLGFRCNNSNGLDRLTAALADGSAGGVKVTTRHGEPWISLPKLEKLDEPTGLQALEDEVVRRWGVLDLLDVLKNADFDTGFIDEFTSVAAYERIDRAVLQRRLILALFAPGHEHGHPGDRGDW
jgi:hypothetical protein